MSTFDLAARTHTITGRNVYPLDRAEPTAHGLHYRRKMPGHPTLEAQEAHLLPGLDLVVTRFTPLPDHSPHSRLYLDMSTIETGPERWTVRDLYLDVIVQVDGVPVLWDEDEYAEAVLEGHLTADEQCRALLGAARVVNGLFAHGNDLETWLASLNIHLDWWAP